MRNVCIALAIMTAMPALTGVDFTGVAQEAGPQEGQTFRDCISCPEMVVVPAGSFMMGSPSDEAGRDEDEGPVHRVTIAAPFAVGAFEVTVGQFAAFVEATGYRAGDRCMAYLEDGSSRVELGRTWRVTGFDQDEHHPVTCVNGDDVRAYLQWLSMETGETYRLLSEAEWEYVARAGTSTRFFHGDDESQQCRYVNAADLTLKEGFPVRWEVADCHDGYVYTAPVGSFEANAFGLYDVHGNVWEWVEDCWHDTYENSPSDGSAWTKDGDCTIRVLRGGSWDYFPVLIRSANRTRSSFDAKYVNRGIRVARSF